MASPLKRIHYWIAADLLTQARAHGIALPSDFTANLTDTVRDAHCSALVEEREAAAQHARDAARRERWRTGGWRF